TTWSSPPIGVMPTCFFLMKPNAGPQPHRGAVQRDAYQRRTALPGVGCRPMLGWVEPQSSARQLREQEPALGLGNGSPQFLRRLDPFRDDGLDVGERLLVGGAIRST